MSEFTLAVLLIFVVFPYIDKMTKEAKAQTAALRELADAVPARTYTASSPALKYTREDAERAIAQADAAISVFRANKGNQ